MRSILLVAVLSIAAVTLAADEPKPAGPKNPAALSAIAKHEKTLADAAQAYQDTKRKADQELVVTLKKVQADVMKGGGPAALAEGNAIQTVIDKTAQQAQTKAEEFSGSKWLHVQSKGIVTLQADGQAACTVWRTTGRWEPLSDRSVHIREPGGRLVTLTVARDDRNAIYAFDDDGTAVLAQRQH